MKNIILIFAFMFVANISDAQSVIQRNKTKDKVEKTSRSTQSRTNPAPRKPNAIKGSKPASGYENGHEWVDLGLSVKWATCNVGASTPSDYGGYYAWGETTTKSIYDGDNCFDKDCAIYKLNGLTRIHPTSGHDTARENWGGIWRMPSDTECNELRDKCKWIWTSKNGHSGYIVTGLNGNSIFLPAVGYHYVTNSYDVGSYGWYWSNTLSSFSSKNAHDMNFHSSGFAVYGSDRVKGQNVRPVMDKN